MTPCYSVDHFLYETETIESILNLNNDASQEVDYEYKYLYWLPFDHNEEVSSS